MNNTLAADRKESFNGMEQRRQQRKSTHGSSRNLKRYSNVRRERLYSAENPMGMGAVAMTNLHRYNHRSSTSHAEILMFKDDNYEEGLSLYVSVLCFHPTGRSLLCVLCVVTGILCIARHFDIECEERL